MRLRPIENVMASFKNKFLILVPALLLSAPLWAQQQIYMCKDANGRVTTSDRPMPECADRATKILGKDGTVRREIPPPLTPEQRLAKKQAEEKRKADEIAAQEQKQKDLLLLSIYRSEKEIEAARQRTVTQARADIIEANNAADAAERKKRAILAEVDKTKHKRPNQNQQAELDEAEQTATAERKRADKLEADLVQQKEKFDGILARFRELNAREEEKAKGGRRP